MSQEPQELAQLDPAQLSAIEEQLILLSNMYRRPTPKEPESGRRRVDIAYCLLIELPIRGDNVFEAIQVSEALGHRVYVELDRGGKEGAIPYALQFFAFVDERGG